MKSIISSPTTPYHSSSSDHIAIDIDQLTANLRAEKRPIDCPISPRASGSTDQHTGATTTAAPRSANALRLQGLLIRGANNELALEGKRDKTAAAQSSLTFISQAVPDLVRAYRATRDAYRDKIKAMLSVDDLKQPSAMEGTITRGTDGKLQSSDRFVNAVLKFVDTKFPGELEKLDIPQGTKLSLPLEAAILLNARQFEHGCTVHHIDVTDADEPISIDINVTTYSARQAIKKGARGFAEGARLNLDVGDLEPASAFTGEASTSHTMPDTKGAPDLHPFAFLQGVDYRIETEHPQLKQFVENAFNEAKPAHLQAATLELRGRLGAHAINMVFNQKDFDWKLRAAMALSLAGSTGIAYLLDVKVVGKIVDEAGKKWGKDSARTRFVEAIASSTVPSPAEFTDSLMIKRVIERLRGKSLLPESLEDFKDDVKDSAISGLIAAIGSLPSNLVQMSRKGGAIAGNVVTNGIATATSAAMAPIEVAKARDELVAGVIQQRKAGFFPDPQTDAARSIHMTPARSLLKEVENDVEGALDATPGVAETINSMGIGQVISQAAFAPVAGLTHAHVISQLMQKVALIAVNTPTEVLSFGTGIVTGKYVGCGGLITTDEEKSRRIGELIINKAIQRIENARQGKGDATVDVTESELCAIEHPAFEWTFPAGKRIVNVMNGTVDLFTRVALVGLGKTPKPGLAEKAAESVARRTVEEV
ncbi:hypothetical protein [Burkholderia lata]|uniref:hypothetical protein n=1 Tax=Burkholderia lata (strain ATCC 17760 / DSM 23089 / LMG 22485 / NCIMB 9086 / R18194 / 383) TaxID=482957 RepID=UPI001453CE6B|nr:hypothetical protein [Burkholderia lata]VWB88153.1 hypothetical protein BLA15816_04238 [Burkholderia lata]